MNDKFAMFFKHNDDHHLRISFFYIQKTFYTYPLYA